MNTQAIAFDMDDTLLRDDRTISPYTVEVLRRAARLGVRVIPASGRAQGSLRGFVEELGCAAAYITCNGAELWRGDHTLIHREMLDVPLARECAAFAAERDCYCQVYYGDRFYYSQRGEYAKSYAASSLLEGEYVGDVAAFIQEPTTKVLMMAAPEKIADMLAEARARLAGRAQVTCSKPYFLEINPLLATKGNALARAAEALGFDMARAVAFGDSLNDLSMLEAAGLGVAMENGREDVKALIPTHCGRNEEDGVARFIEQHLLREERL